MAEFLICNRVNSPIEERGDIVEVRQDGAKYGRLETKPDFIVIKVPSMDYETAANYRSEIGQNGRRFKISPGLIGQANSAPQALTMNNIPDFVSQLTDKG